MDRDVKKYTVIKKNKYVDYGVLIDNVAWGKNKGIEEKVDGKLIEVDFMFKLAGKSREDIERYKKNKRVKRRVIMAVSAITICAFWGCYEVLKVKADENKRYNEQKTKILQMTELPLEERYIKILNTLNCSVVESAKIKEELAAKGCSVVETVDEQERVTYSLQKKYDGDISK